MPSQQDKDSFFSISFDLILIDKELPYDLYVNSSAKQDKDHYVRIHPQGRDVSFDDLKDFKKKYHQLYVPESQRDDYLRSLVECEGVSDIRKTEVIKDSAIHYLNNVFAEGKEFSTEILGEAIEGCRESVESMVDVIQDYDIKDIQELIGDLSFHDFYTYDHSINVSMYCMALYKALKPKAERNEVVTVGLGGLLHDLGKVKIPTHILNNAGELSEDELYQIRQHPTYGIDLLDEHMVSLPGIDFKIIRRIIHEHHENYNGTGYPNKLKGKEIHYMARVAAIADFFDAVTTKRSYHEALKIEDALAIMERSVGKKIDPEIFKIFMENVHGLVLKGKANRELPDDFDPSMPHEVLPFRPIQANIKEKDFFRKEEDKGAHGSVRLNPNFAAKKQDKKKKKKAA